MAPQRKKTTNLGAHDAEGSNLHEVPVGQSPPIEPTPAQLAEKEKRTQAERAIQAKKAAAASKKAAAVATTTTEDETLNNFSQPEDDQLEQNMHNELNLQLRALEMKKAHLANQLVSRKRAAEQAQRLAEAKRKVAEMQAEIQKIQEEVGQPQEPSNTHTVAGHSRQHEGQDLRQTTHIYQDQHFQPSPPFDSTSPLSIALQQTSWPYGYKPVQLPKYDGSVDPAQFIMTYEATIASAGGDDPIMAKSFVMACEGPVANWYSYIQPLSIQSWVQLKEKLKQDFQVFKRLSINTLQQFSCIQMDREPLPEYLRRFVQKKAQTPNFSEKDAIAKFIEGLLPSQLASHLDREPPRSLSELYAEVEKYAKSEADHKRRVEQRKLMRQQLSWQQNNQTNTSQQN